MYVCQKSISKDCVVRFGHEVLNPCKVEADPSAELDSGHRLLMTSVSVDQFPYPQDKGHGPDNC